MKTKTLVRYGLVAAITGATGALAFAALADSSAPEPSLRIKDFIGDVEIREGSTLSYVLDMNENLVPQPVVTKKDGFLEIDGRVDANLERCNNKGNVLEMRLRGGKERPLAAYPKLIIEVPAHSGVEIGLVGGKLKMGDARDLSLAFLGCGDATYGNIEKELSLSVKGSGDITGGNSGTANISIAGSGDVQAKEVSGEANIEISGSGDVSLGDVAGPVSVSVRGSGDTNIASANKALSVVLYGSGDVSVEGGTVETLSVDVVGSGDVSFKGTADDVSVLLKGSGDVYVARLTGNRVVDRYGSGDVRIGSWRSGD